jgi:hypothetical protein
MKQTHWLDQEIHAVNVGSELFAQALKNQGVDVVSLAWSPPRTVKLSPRIKHLLDILEGPDAD